MSGRLNITFAADMPPASVEVVAPDYSTVGRVWLSAGAQQGIDVPSEGSFLRVHLASGETVTLKSPGTLDRTISKSDLVAKRTHYPVDASPKVRLSSRRDVQRRAAMPVLEARAKGLRGGPTEVVLEGDLNVKLEDDGVVALPGDVCEENTAVVFTPRMVPHRYILTLAAREGRVRVRVPGSAREVTVRSNELESGQRVASVRVETRNAHADALAGYLHRGDLHSASSMTGWAEQAEGLLRQKMADPFAAVVGAFLLLRMRQVELLHDWTANLLDSFPQITDAIVIRAWHLIFRRGDEKEIRGLFERAVDGPLPTFTEGLRLLSDGARLLGADAEKAVDKLNHHVRRSLSRSPFTATAERYESAVEGIWDVDIDYASGG